MARNDSTGMIVALVAGLLGLISVFGYFLIEELGAWWQLETFIYNFYINAFGYLGEELILNEINLVAGIIFIIGIALILFNIISKSKKLSLLSFIMMAAGLALFVIALTIDYENITGDYGVIATWGAGIGFYIGIGACVLSLISAALMD
ncbi:MAG: hypothetical protein GF317_04295 [Candidatus Lokiarchaeota archaeon]|nr:hypothetical protein [Candidatus Lokiarchaeota archaeon]MBD3199109.1 hypothetical protein [Candidatus Lokiarchaeota archaeon]